MNLTKYIGAFKNRSKILEGIKNNIFNKSSCSSVNIAFHFPSGQSEDKDLVLSFNEQPQLPQHGCVPETKHLEPSVSKKLQDLQKNKKIY